MKKYLYIIGVTLIVGVILGSFIPGCKKGGDAMPLSVLIACQDSLAIAKADLVSASDMITLLRSANGSLDKKVRVQAATIANVKAELAQVQGGGAGTPAENGWSNYKDGYLVARFRQAPDSLQYMQAVRPISIELIEGLANDWICNGWDELAGKPATIKKFAVKRNSEWSPKIPWYKKLKAGGGAGYFDNAFIVGVVGYNKLLLMPMVGYDDKPIYGGAIVRTF